MGDKGLARITTRLDTSLRELGMGKTEYLQRVDLRPLATTLRRIPSAFLASCAKLRLLNLGGLGRVVGIGSGFAMECENLQLVSLRGMHALVTLGKNALRECTALRRVCLQGLHALGALPDYFAYQCAALESLDLSPLVALTSTGYCCLSFCSSLSDACFSNLGELRRIGAGFMTCCNVKVVDLSSLRSLQEIAQGFFANCASLFSVNLRLPNVTRIGACLFRECTAMTSVDFSAMASLTTLDGSACAGCTALTSVNFDGLSRLRVIGGKSLMDCTSLTSVDFRPLSSLKEIGDLVLARCSALKSVHGSHLTQLRKIGESFLCDCVALEHVDLSHATALVDIEGKAFAGCASLRTVCLAGLVALERIDDPFMPGCPRLAAIDPAQLTAMQPCPSPYAVCLSTASQPRDKSKVPGFISSQRSTQRRTFEALPSTQSTWTPARDPRYCTRVTAVLEWFLAQDAAVEMQPFAGDGGVRERATVYGTLGAVFLQRQMLPQAETALQRATSLLLECPEVVESHHLQRFVALSDLQWHLRQAAQGPLEVLHGARTFIKNQKAMKEDSSSGSSGFLASLPSGLSELGVQPEVTIGHQELGRGAEAVVYAGTVDGVPCAVRAPTFVHTPSGSPDVPKQLLDLTRFATIWTNLPPHPNVLRLLHEVCSDDMVLSGETYRRVPKYLFCELCPFSLASELARNAKTKHFLDERKDVFTTKAFLDVAAGVAAGLAHLHSLGHVHRDIKPDNVLLGADGAWKVGDLGLVGSDASGSKILTLRGSTLYRAPEQWKANADKPGYAKFSVKADVWSFGILLLHMVTTLRFGRCRDGIVWALYDHCQQTSELNDHELWSTVTAYFRKEDPPAAKLFQCGTPLGEVLLRCLRVSSRKRITMAEVVRWLRGETPPEPPNDEGRWGELACMSGPIDKEDIDDFSGSRVAGVTNLRVE